MNNSLKEQFRNIIMNRIRLLKGRGGGEDNATEHMADDVDLSAELQRKQVDVVLGSIKQNEIDYLLEALDKIDEGTYGICEKCEETIPVGRLKIQPAARLCVTCQDVEEKRGGAGRTRYFQEINLASLGKQGGYCEL